MKPFTAQQFPTHKHARNHSASIPAKIARLVLAVIVALAQPIHAQSEPPDPQQVRTELGKVVADLRTALAQLARIEAEAATLPKTFTAGGQTQNRWNQLNAEKERWTTEQGKALERFDQLVTQSKALPPGNAAVAELLTLCNQLTARNDAAIKAAQTKLSGIEGTLRRGPSTFAKGSQIEVWQTQLNREKEYWTGNLATLGKEHEKLAAQLATLKSQSSPAKVVAGATEPAKVVATPTAQTTTPASVPPSVPAVPANDKTYALLDDLVKAIKAWQQYKKEGNEVEATIQSDLIEKLRRNPAWLDECMIFGGLGDDVGSYYKVPEKALAALAKYRADYPAIRADYDKKRAFDVAIAVRRKEEADKEAFERRRVEEEKAKATAPQREAQKAAQVKMDAEKEAAMKKPGGSPEETPATLANIAKNRKLVIGVWTSTGQSRRDPLGNTWWEKWVIKEDGTLDSYEAQATANGWGDPRHQKFRITTGKYSDTGERYYGVLPIATDYKGDPMELFPAIIDDDGHLYLRVPAYDMGTVHRPAFTMRFDRGDKNPFSP